MRIILRSGLGIISVSLLAGCGGNPVKAQYKDHPRDFMRQVVTCESQYATIGHTARCRQTLRLNAKLFMTQ